MRKLFFLIPAMLLSLMASATSQTISPSSEESDSNIRSALSGTADTIILNAGNYKEADQIHFRRNAVIMAAEGADVIITPKYYCDFVYENTKVKIIGIKFDGSVSGQQAIRVYDNQPGKELRLENCEFYNFSKAVISGDNSTYPLDSCIINNCYFHNNKKSSIYFVKSTVEGVQTCHGLIVKNSTFANIDVNESAEHYASVIDVNTYDYSNVVASDVEVLVDHCTFYNYLTYNTDHCAVRVRRATNTTVSNCIFAHPTEQERRSTYCYNGLITNCLSYNLTKSTSTQTHASTSDNTITNCAIANPLFTDAANGDFSFAGNWVTMELSPARGAATDGSDLGDPRWYSAEILPSSNFVAPYAFVGEKAQISGNLWYNSTDDYLYYNDKEVCGTAKWKIHATRACAVKATLNMNAGTSTGHIFRVELLDANGNHVDEVAEPAQSSAAGDIDLPNPLAIPAEGDYTVILHNDQEWSSAKINSITLIYIGGAVVTIPAEEVLGAEAVLVNDGSLKVSKLENGDLKYGDNGSPLTEYVYWNINATKYGRMNVTANVVAPGEGDPSGHQFLIELYTDLNESPITSSAEASTTSATGAIALPTLNIPATGNYIVKLTNQKQWSSAILHSIEFAYAGGEVVAVPGQILGADALLEKSGSKYMIRTEEGYLKSSNNGSPTSEWAVWNVSASAGTMNVTLNLDPVTSNGHNYRVELYEGETLIDYTQELETAELSDAVHSKGNVALEKQLVIPANGTYTIKLINRTQWSSMILHGITFAPYVAPAGITMSEEDANSDAWEDKLNGDAVNITLTRTIIAGMYNTLCLPFPVSSTQCKAIFGNDVELLTMDNATLSGDILTITFNTANDIYQGTPMLIKTSSNIVNPTFEGVTIKRLTPSATDGDAAEFIGTFFPTSLVADRDLFVGQNNTVHFPSNDNKLKGLRAYFHVTAASAQAIKRARIVTREEVITEIDLVNGENNGVIKTIENGQLIINLDGIRFNVMGNKIQ